MKTVAEGKEGKGRIDRELGVILVPLAVALGAAYFYPKIVAALTVLLSVTAVYMFQGHFDLTESKKSVLLRKLPHVVGGGLLIFFLITGNLWFAAGLTAASTISYMAVIVEHRFLHRGGMVTAFASKLGIISGGNGSYKYVSSAFYAFSALSILYITAHTHAVAAGVASLTFGDAAAALVGVNGRFRTGLAGKKTLEGSLSMLFVTLIAVYLISGQLYRSVATAAAATLVEALPVGSADNVLVPIVAAVVYEIV
ncbi:MAG: hypothetical protein QXI37_03870 [Thermoprotei archaeon]